MWWVMNFDRFYFLGVLYRSRTRTECQMGMLVSFIGQCSTTHALFMVHRIIDVVCGVSIQLIVMRGSGFSLPVCMLCTWTTVNWQLTLIWFWYTKVNIWWIAASNVAAGGPNLIHDICKQQVKKVCGNMGLFYTLLASVAVGFWWPRWKGTQRWRSNCR